MNCFLIKSLNLTKILLNSSGYDAKMPVYDFEKLDTFLDKITYEYDLLPTIEFMTTLKFELKDLCSELWQNLAFQITSRYLGKFCMKSSTCIYLFL